MESFNGGYILTMCFEVTINQMQMSEEIYVIQLKSSMKVIKRV